MFFDILQDLSVLEGGLIIVIIFLFGVIRWQFKNRKYWWQQAKWFENWMNYRQKEKMNYWAKMHDARRETAKWKGIADARLEVINEFVAQIEGK